eukprot:CCRYP_015445-RC/>CCRYP_015445-RC protein AED:0.48 eAED:0.56 QI:0/0/0/1/0/0/2/0/132
MASRKLTVATAERMVSFVKVSPASSSTATRSTAEDEESSNESPRTCSTSPRSRVVPSSSPPDANAGKLAASSWMGVNGCEYERHCDAQFRRRFVMSTRLSCDVFVDCIVAVSYCRDVITGGRERQMGYATAV